MANWRFDSTQWWSGDHGPLWTPDNDIVIESPSGQFAAVLYHVVESNPGYDAASLAILASPPERPRVVFGTTPETGGFWCCGFRQTVQWICGDQYLMVSQDLYMAKHGPYAHTALCLLDINRQRYSMVPALTSRVEIRPTDAEGRWFIHERPYGQDARHRSYELDLCRMTWLPWNRIADFGSAFFGGEFGTVV